ncbi:MAG: S9 family peptidase, partial [Euryarchaeota archaeon]|nr:S9 family peptidase [Euryarchaeota archaeon]
MAPHVPRYGPVRPPPTPRRPVWDTYHGVRVRDDYRWLENGGSQEVRRWSRAQNRAARSFLDALPARPYLLRHYHQLFRRGLTFWVALRYAGGRLFAMRWDTRGDRPTLEVFPSSHALRRPHRFLDPRRFDQKGMPASIDRYAPSWDGRHVAVSVSLGGTEESDLTLLDGRSSRRTGEVVHRAARAGAGGSLAWTPGSDGFYYTRFPAPGERRKEDLEFYQQLYFHRLGTSDDEDLYALGKDFPRIAEVKVSSIPNRPAFLVAVAHGDGGDFEFWSGDGQAPWHAISKPHDRVVGGALGRDGRVYLLSRKGAPRGKVLSLPNVGEGLAASSTLLQEGRWVIDDLVATPRFLFLVEELGGEGRLRAIDLRSGAVHTAKTPRPSVVEGVAPLEGDEVLFHLSTFLEPPQVLRWSPGRGPPRRTPLSARAPVRLPNLEVKREVATSRDGTKVPMWLVRRRAARHDGPQPLLLRGYGGYGISTRPQYMVWESAWLAAGGAVVETMLRGGGEFGEGWHRAGMLTKKQNVFDDFLACAEHLVSKKHTSPEKLAIEGGSNGGLLMGAALTQRPELFRAVVAHVAVLDSLRSEMEVNGQFNVTEFGTVKDRAQFRSLHAYSPYHHVEDGTPYPSVLFATGENDRRVNPFHSR